MAKFSLTLVCVTLGLVLAASSSAATFTHRRRDHADLGRLIGKRAPADASSAQAPSTSAATQPAQATSAAAQTSSVNSASVQATSELASASASPSPSATSAGSVLSSVVSGLVPTESSAAVSSSAPAASSVSNHPSSALGASSALASESSAETPSQSSSQSVLYLTASSNAPTPTQTSSTSTTSSGMSHTAMTVLIVIAASVGAAVIVWTIIRKWKFKPSSDFEGRMQPIDWQPGGNDEDPGLPGQRRLSRASSFHSGSADDQMRGPVGGYGAPVLNPIPDHDFTAGAAHLAPVGGYADLARGPSPQPMMQESLGPAPSINRPVQYDQYGVPLHHGYAGY